jgi:hypothetical protein
MALCDEFALEEAMDLSYYWMINELVFLDVSFGLLFSCEAGYNRFLKNVGNSVPNKCRLIPQVCNIIKLLHKGGHDEL